MKYELDTIYQAFVSHDETFARLYFVFDYDYYRVTVKDAYDGNWKIYHIAGSMRFTHTCDHGTWKAVLGQGGVKAGVRWEYRRGGHVHFPSISLADTDDPNVIDSMRKGKHYDAIVEDDIVDAMEDVMQDVHRRKRAGIITNITEGGNEMHKELYHVILFNRKTEKIDYKAYITAADETEAAMTAAHDYDKYDAKVHKHIVKMIEGSEYEVIK